MRFRTAHCHVLAVSRRPLVQLRGATVQVGIALVAMDPAPGDT